MLSDMLSAAQLEFFDQYGYLVVEDVLDQTTILDPVRREYAVLLDNLIAEWQATGALGHMPEGLDFYGKLKFCYEAGCDWFQPMDISLPGDAVQPDTPMHFGPAVFDMLTNKRLLDIAECLIGPEITSNPIQHVRLKPPVPDLRHDEVRAHVAATDWHQDRGVAHDEADATDMITVWIAVSDATEENGCLQVIPQSKGAKLLPHCAKTQTAIADGFIDLAKAKPLPVRSGGVVIFHPLTAHSSLNNNSDKFRWSFDIRFNKTGQPTGRGHFPEFIARSAANPSSELKEWQVWRSMWEAARTNLADKSHIPIHRWTSDAPYCA